jgi:hypothetical protein
MSSYIVKWGEYFGERNEEEFEYQDGDNLDKLDAESAAIESYYTAIQDYGWDWCYILHNGKCIKSYDKVDDSLQRIGG